MESRQESTGESGNGMTQNRLKPGSSIALTCPEHVLTALLYFYNYFVFQLQQQQKLLFHKTRTAFNYFIIIIITKIEFPNVTYNNINSLYCVKDVMWYIFFIYFTFHCISSTPDYANLNKIHL